MKYIYLLFFTCTINSFSQIKNGVITYGVIINEIEKYSDNEFVNNLQKEAKEVAHLYVSTLSFNAKESSFVLKEVVLQDNKDFGLYQGFLDIQSNIYENRDKKVFRSYFDNNRIGEVVKIDTLKYNWVITNETKDISGYKCYKATTFRYSDSGVMDEKYAITAWFTPKIPVPYGPNGYGKLPGLILELQSFMSTIYVKTINLNVEEELKFDTLEKYPQLTSDEIYKYMMSSMTQEQKKAVMDSKRIK